MKVTGDCNMSNEQQKLWQEEAYSARVYMHESLHAGLEALSKLFVPRSRSLTVYICR